MKDHGIDEKIKKKIISIVSGLLPQTKILLFGSRATGRFREGSDIDIALDAGKPLEFFDVCEVRNLLEASYIPYKVDVVDLHSVSQEMRDAITRDGVLLNI